MQNNSLNQGTEQALNIEVFGRVQGVRFRQNVKDFCDGIGLIGNVRNREDGSVLIFVQGRKAKLDELLSWLRICPGFSNVEGVAYTSSKIRQDVKNFSIIKKDAFFADQIQSFKNLGKSILGMSHRKVPKHIAIIPDGNRRWAREKGFEASKGHLVAGEFEHLKELMDEAKKMGVKYISFWGFSTENWSRDKIERDIIFDMIIKIIPKLKDECLANGIRFRHLGRKDRLPKELISGLKNLEKTTENNNNFFMQICLDYGGRDEIIRAINRAIDCGVSKMDENIFRSFLDTKEIPDPDLIIRTSGEQRTSGLMPFQSAYSELYFSNVYFPDFNALEIRKAIESFGKRVRRFGGTAREDLSTNTSFVRLHK